MKSANLPVLGFILKGYPRISETFISNEILLLEKQGYPIHIFSMRRPRENYCHDSVRQIRARVDYLPERILSHLPRLIYYNLILAMIQPIRYLQSLKMAFRRFLRTRKSATVKHLLQAGYLVRHLLPQKGIVHLHAHFAHSPTSVAMFASRLSGLPFSFTAHAKDIYTSDPRQLREKMEQARFVITCTEYNKRHLTALLKGNQKPIHRVYHGIDLDLFSNTHEIKQPEKPFTILTVARMTVKKGLPTVLKAIRILSDKGMPIRHTLIGDGDDREQILSLIKALGLSHQVRWLGTQPHHVVLEHYQRADLFVLGCEVAPNGDRDGIPNVFLESMAMGVPVVSTHISAIPEIVTDGETGRLVPPGDPEQMADAMNQLLTQPDLRKKIIKQAKERVLKKYDNKVLINDLFQIYRDAGI